MKINIAYPATGAQKVIEIEDEKKLRLFMEKRIAAEVPADELGDEFKGYVFKITGGNDKDGFPMKQGVLVNHRVRLLLDKDSGCFRTRKNKGEKRRKSVRGCIVGPDLAVISVIVVRKGEEEIPGLTDTVIPRRLGPKRASKIRKLFNLSKEDDVRKYVIKREVTRKSGKKYFKYPKIQRLVTALTLQRHRRMRALKKRRQETSRLEAHAYAKLLAQRRKQFREARLSRKISQLKKAGKVVPEALKKAAVAAKKQAAVAAKTVEERKAGAAKPKPEAKKAAPAKKGAAPAAAAPAKKGAASKAATPAKKGAEKKAAPAKKGGDKKAAAPAPAPAPAKSSGAAKKGGSAKKPAKK